MCVFNQTFYPDLQISDTDIEGDFWSEVQKSSSRTIYVNVDSPNPGFPYFNFLRGYQWKKSPSTNIWYSSNWTVSGCSSFCEAARCSCTRRSRQGGRHEGQEHRQDDQAAHRHPRPLPHCRVPTGWNAFSFFYHAEIKKAQNSYENFCVFEYAKASLLFFQSLTSCKHKLSPTNLKTNLKYFVCKEEF